MVVQVRRWQKKRRLVYPRGGEWIDAYYLLKLYCARGTLANGMIGEVVQNCLIFERSMHIYAPEIHYPPALSG